MYKRTLSRASSHSFHLFLCSLARSFFRAPERSHCLECLEKKNKSSLVGHIEQLYFEHIHHLLLLYFDISISADRPTSDDSTRCVYVLRTLFVANVVSTQTVLSVIFSFRHFLFYSLRDSRQFTANKNR